jgi:hypothetical protein
MTIRTTPSVSPPVDRFRARHPALDGEAARACVRFIDSADIEGGRRQSAACLEQVLKARPDLPARAVDGLQAYVYDASDRGRRQLRIDHAVRVLRENPAIDGADFYQAAVATAGAFSQKEAAARLEEQIAERQARTLMAARDAAPEPSGGGVPGVTSEMLRKLDRDPAVAWCTTAGELTSRRLTHFHDALDGDRGMLFSLEPSLYTHLDNRERGRQDGLVAVVSVAGVIGCAALGSILPVPYQAAGLVGGLVGGLLAAGVTRRVLEHRTAKVVEREMRETLAPQRKWWEERSAALSPFCKETREKTLERIWIEESKSPPPEPGHVEVGDGSVDIGGVKVGRRA